MKIEKTDTYMRSDAQFARIGPVEMETPRGNCIAYDAPGLTSLEIRDGEGKIISAAIMVYEPEPGHGLGMICQMGSDGARAFAASLLRIADLMEPPTLNS